MRMDYQCKVPNMDESQRVSLKSVVLIDRVTLWMQCELGELKKDTLNELGCWFDRRNGEIRLLKSVEDLFCD